MTTTTQSIVFKWKLDFNSDYQWTNSGKLYNTKTNKMKTQDKKTEQGYNPKPTISMCSNCKHYKSDFVVNEYNYKQEKNIRCGIGEFAVKKQGVCNLHQFQD